MTPGMTPRLERGIIMGLGAAAGVLAFGVYCAQAGKPFLPSYQEPGFPLAAVASAPPSVPASSKGEALYREKCAACHQPDGAGLPGAFPPLAGSSWLVRDIETPIRIALLGVSGPIEVGGAKFDGAMPTLGLTDEEVAQILSYVRSAFGNGASALLASDVARVRASLAGRTEAWKAEALQQLRDTQ